MKTEHKAGIVLSALFGIALFKASCTTTSDLQPRHRQTGAPSVLPLVRIPQMPSLVFVNASVNGREGLFIVDTGANATCLDASFAKALGLKTRAIAAWRTRSNVSGGLKVTWVDTLAMGNDVFETFAVAVLDLSHLSPLAHPQIDGILGMNILSTTVCQVDPHQGLLSLYPSGSADNPVPIKLERGEIFMDAQFNGRTIYMKVDTGTDTTRINSNDFASVAKSAVLPTSRVIKTRADVNRVVTNSLQRELRLECRLGDIIRKDLLVEDGGERNLLGMDFFQHYVVTFDFKMGKAYFTDWAANQSSEVTARKLAEPQR